MGKNNSDISKYKAIKDYKKSISAMKDRNMDKYGKIVSFDAISEEYKQLGILYAEEGRFSEANKTYQEALSYAKDSNLKNEIIEQMGKSEPSSASKKHKRLNKKPSFLEKLLGSVDKEVTNIEKKIGIRKYSLFVFLSMISFVFALFFSSFKLTGAVTGSLLSQSNSTFLGTGFFVLGLIFVFISFKKRK